MKTLFALISALLLSLPVYSAESACMSEAAKKKLYGAARNSFVRKCERDKCEAMAQQKKLAGAAKNSFMKKCSADGLLPYCEVQANDKKLRGAARTSFMNKCQSE